MTSDENVQEIEPGTGVPEEKTQEDLRRLLHAEKLGKALREFADWVETEGVNVQLPQMLSGYVWLYEREDDEGYPKREMRAAAKHLPGRREKRQTSSSFEVSCRFGDLIYLEYNAPRAAVCERVVVGTETVEVTDYENAPTKTEEREIVEWRCEPSLLADEAGR
jgi:hypothetical protein